MVSPVAAAQTPSLFSVHVGPVVTLVPSPVAVSLLPAWFGLTFTSDYMHPHMHLHAQHTYELISPSAGPTGMQAPQPLPPKSVISVSIPPFPPPPPPIQEKPGVSHCVDQSHAHNSKMVYLVTFIISTRKTKFLLGKQSYSH